jgi:outer membrane protein assembly factor BamB
MDHEALSASDSFKCQASRKTTATGVRMIYCGTSGHVTCIDERSGKEIWRIKLETAKLFNAAASGDVTVLLMDKVLVAACNGHIWGLSPNDGNILWHNGLPGLGNRFITMCAPHVAIQYVHAHTESSQAIHQNPAS